jgi:nicotinamide riboside kinase
MRIYFIGSHSTGKTTMARFVSRRYGLPMISEVARSVLAELEMPLERLRADIDAVNDYQRKVFERQVEVEQSYESGFVSDRAFDSVAYTAEHTTILADIMQSKEFGEYMDWVRSGVVFYLRPHPHLLKEDGVRAAVDWESVIRIDGMIKLLCEQYRIQYLPVESLNMQERVKAVKK